MKISGTVLLQVVISGPESIVFRSDGASFFFLNVTLRISIPPARIHLRASAELWIKKTKQNALIMLHMIFSKT